MSNLDQTNIKKIREEIDKIDLRRSNVNLLLKHLELAKSKVEEASVSNNLTAYSSWAYLSDHIYDLLTKISDHDRATYKRIQFRIDLIESGKLVDDDLVSVRVILEWLTEKLRNYTIEAVTEKSRLFKQNPSVLSSNDILQLRKLRYWLVTLQRLKHHKLPSHLQQWSEFSEHLP